MAQKLIQNSVKTVPELSQGGSRWPLESSLGSGTLPKPFSTRKLRLFWSQNWIKIDSEAIKNGKMMDSATDFEFDTVF